METIGKYQVLGELGRGATGKVVLAMDPFGKRRVAIKVAYPDALKSSTDGALYKNMFLNEASLAGKLNHPHVVKIFDAVVEDDHSYIVMEYVEGGTLEKFCNPASLLEPAEVAEIIFKCARALAFAGRLGLTHRDIKPGNILHVEGTDIKIADFGASINKVSEVTVISNVGSPAYMAPELIEGNAQASASTDIYALGVVMYYMLAGRLPFMAPSTMAMIYQIVNSEVPPPSTFRQGLMPELDAIVLKAMAKSPDDRYATWEEFARDLGEVWKTTHKPDAQEKSDAERFNMARGLAFFKDFPENELWEVLRISQWRKFPPETALIKEGDIGDSFFILAGGYVRVTRAKRTLSVLSAGDCFGEMCYLAHKDSARRSATVTTNSDCVVVKVRSDDLRKASDSCRRLFDQRFLDTLVARLEATNEQLAVMS